MKLSQFISEFMLSPTLALRFSIAGGFSIMVFPMVSYVTKNEELNELVFLYGHTQILTPDVEITHIEKGRAELQDDDGKTEMEDYIELYNDGEIVVDVISLVPGEIEVFYKSVKDIGGIDNG